MARICALFFTATDFSNPMLELFHYQFIVNAFVAGGAIAVAAPLIGTFLVVKRFSLFSDSLSHVALAGVAIGLLAGIYPVLTAVIACIVAAVMIEWLRTSGKIYADAALSLFLSGSLAIALVLISLAHGFNVNLFSYLFGSVTAVETEDLVLIWCLTALVILLVGGFYKKLLYVAFDEEAAKVSGLPVRKFNLLLMILAAVMVSLSMRIVGILMVGALMVIPVLSALQIAKSFKHTLLYSLGFSLSAVFGGLFLSYYLDIVAGGAIVLLALILFIVTFFFGSFYRAR